jgi:hypothetical protein
VNNPKGYALLGFSPFQKRVSRDFKNEGHNPDLKTSMRISRIKELKKEINKSK